MPYFADYKVLSFLRTQESIYLAPKPASGDFLSITNNQFTNPVNLNRGGIFIRIFGLREIFVESWANGDIM